MGIHTWLGSWKKPHGAGVRRRLRQVCAMPGREVLQ
jgi:hypothetical protein